MKLKHPAGLTLFGLVLVGGCSVTTEPEPETVVVSGDSVLTVTWTVDGTSDPSACAVEGADAIDVVVETPGGSLVSEVLEDCAASVTHISLPRGSYDADAALLDSAGHTITTRVELGPITLYGDDELIVDADFPPDSFY